MAGRLTNVDQEIAVHFRHLGTADAQTPAAGRVDQLPGAVSRRILEGRAASLFADRLRGFAVVLYFVHPHANGIRCGDPPAKARRGKNDGSVGADDIAIGADVAEAARTEPDYHARHAAIAHDQVGADADDIEGKLASEMR